MKTLILYLTLCGIAAGQLTPTFKPVGSNGEQVNASPFLTALGGTTAGKALFQMANPGAVRYLRINADNSVSQLDASTFLSGIGGGSSSFSGLTGQPADNANLASALGTRALLSPAETFSATVLALVASHRTANSNANPEALLAWARCLTELETGGILTNVKEGLCLRSNSNSATAYMGIKNTSATVTGAVPITPDGALFSADATNHLDLSVSDSRVFTLSMDYHFAPDAPSDTAIASLVASGGTAVAGTMVNSAASLGDGGAVFSANSGSAVYTDAIGNSGDAYCVNRFNPCDTILSLSSDNAASPTYKVTVNGVSILTDSTGNFQATTALTKLVLGAWQNTSSSYQFGFKGVIGSVLLFDKVLSSAENLVVAKAMRHLDPRKRNLITNGDSRTAQLSDSTHRTGNWPYQLANSAAKLRNARLINVAVNGMTAAGASLNFNSKLSHLRPNGTSILTADYYHWYGANDVQAAYTGAQIWATMRDMGRAARALQMRVVCITDPEGGGAYSAPQEAERVALNGLIRNAPNEFDALLDLDATLGNSHDSRWWLNAVHLNNAGNGMVADWISRSGIGGFGTASGGIVNNDIAPGAAINLTSKVAGILPPVNGGTGMSALGRVGAYSNADQVLTTGVFNKVLFQTEEEDTGNNFASSTFTAPAACHVLVTVAIYKSAGVSSVDTIGVFKNGSATDRAFTQTTYAAQVFGITAVVKCAANDTLDIQYYAANTGTIGTAQPLTRVTFTVMP